MKLNLNFSKKTWIILFFLLGFILLIAFFNSKKSLFEGFGTSQYSYLAPVTTPWSQETQDAWTEKAKAGGIPDLSYIMPLVTEEEAKQFLETRLWPYTDYVKGLYKQASDQKLAIRGFSDDVSTIPIETAQSLKPNRSMYGLLAPALKIPPGEVLGKLNEVGGNGYDIGDNNHIICDGMNHNLYILKIEDGVRIGGAPGTGPSTDYTLFEKIPGFKFNSTPYDICVENPKLDFTVNGEAPAESYSIYTGSIAGPTESTPSTVSDSLSSVIPSTSSSTDASSSSSSPNPTYYNDFVSLCKKVVQ